MYASSEGSGETGRWAVSSSEPCDNLFLTHIKAYFNTLKTENSVNDYLTALFARQNRSLIHVFGNTKASVC